MNFGELSNIITFVKEKLSKKIKNKKKKFDKNDIIQLKNEILPAVKLINDKANFELISDIFDRFFTPKYVFSDKLSFENGNNCFRKWDHTFTIDEIDTKEIKIPDNKKKLEAHFQKCFHTPQPEQRSAEWYKYRECRITASDTATALDLNPYEPVEHFIVKKIDRDRIPFIDGIFVFHGRKYEPIATFIYEHIYNNKVTEFGCLPSESFKILGASPDGICSKSTLDGKFSERLGVMLEIKCPAVRKIKTKGLIAGQICPFYYWCQVQQQLECCNFETCDFWQVNIKEYDSREKYLSDLNLDTVLTEGDNSKRVPIDPKICKGCIIQLLPKKYEPRFEEDKPEYTGYHLYPDRLDLTIEEYDNWAIETISNWQTKSPDLAQKFYFDKIIYWYVPNAHNVEVKRDRVWMNHVFPILEKTWQQVEYYKSHPNELDRLYDIGMKRKKFYRLKTKFEINNNLVEKKILFLDDIPLDDTESDDIDCDFLDDDHVSVLTSKVSKLKIKKKKYKKKEININDDCDFLD
jgi:putative phage-type endonuclease